MPPKKTKHISTVVAAEVVKQDSKAARKANTYVLDVVRGDDEDGDDSEELDDMLTESSEDEDEDVKPTKKKLDINAYLSRTPLLILLNK